MLNNSLTLSLDASGKELIEKNAQLFDLSLNDMDLHRYVAGSVPPHWHSELELFVLREGLVTVRIGDQSYELHAGEGFFINTGIIHAVIPKTTMPCLFRSFVFSSTMICGTLENVFYLKYVRPLLENGSSCLLFHDTEADSLYFKEFDTAYRACLNESYGYEFQVRNALSNILLFIMSRFSASSGSSMSSVQDERLKKMLTWIHQNLDKNISVAEIAQTANICPRECQRIFQQYLHYSPIEYLQRIRVFHAAELLTDSDCPITDIALNCGFSNPSYFSKQFKTIMGSRPREYRAASHNGIPIS